MDNGVFVVFKLKLHDIYLDIIYMHMFVQQEAFELSRILERRSAKESVNLRIR